MRETTKEKVQGIEHELWGRHRNNGLKGKVNDLSNKFNDMEKEQQKMIIDINRIGNSFRASKKLMWVIISILISLFLTNIVSNFL